MSRRIFCIFLTIIVALNASAQERHSFISQKYEHFTTDIQENIYGWTSDRLDQYSSEGKLLYHYSNPSMGYISKVDASIPTKIMVYYEESNSIVLLNNKLSPIGNPIDLWGQELQAPLLVSMFGINRIVCYEQASQQITILDLDLRQKDVINCRFDTEFQPQLIVPDLNFEHLMLVDSTAGIAVFDRFGSFQKWIPVQGIRALQLQNNILYFLQGDEFFSQDMQTLWNPVSQMEMHHIQSFSKFLSNWYLLDSYGNIHKLSIRR